LRTGAVEPAGTLGASEPGSSSGGKSGAYHERLGLKMKAKSPVLGWVATSVHDPSEGKNSQKQNKMTHIFTRFGLLMYQVKF
jgi:hypothetical protein